MWGLSQEAWDRLAFVLITTLVGGFCTAIAWFARSILKPYFDAKMEEARAFRKHVEDVGPKLDQMAGAMTKVAMSFDSQTVLLANINKGTGETNEKLDYQTSVIGAHNAALMTLVNAFGSDPLRDICRLNDEQAVVTQIKTHMADQGIMWSDDQIRGMLDRIKKRERRKKGATPLETIDPDDV